MDAVNARIARERIDAAQVQNEHRLRFGVRLIVSKARLDQQLVAIEARGRVAGFAGVARGAQAGDGRGNRSGIVGNDLWRKRRERMETDLNQLLGAVDFGVDESLSSRADVAIDAGHMRVRGDEVSRILRLHHMAGAAAEFRRIHIRRAVIAGGSDHKKIDDGSDKHNIDAVAKDAVVEIDPGKCDGNLSGFLELSAPQKYADRNKRKAEQEDKRQDEDKDDAEIWIVTEMAGELGQPVADHGDGGGSGDCAAREADGVVAEKQRGTKPAALKSLNERHGCSTSMRGRPDGERRDCH